MNNRSLRQPKTYLLVSAALILRVMPRSSITGLNPSNYPLPVIVSDARSKVVTLLWFLVCMSVLKLSSCVLTLRSSSRLLSVHHENMPI